MDVADKDALTGRAGVVVAKEDADTVDRIVSPSQSSNGTLFRPFLLLDMRPVARLCSS